MKICHSDESSYEIGHDSNNYYITRTPKEEMLERNLKPTFRSGRQYVSVWGSFCGRELGPIVVLEKGLKMTAKEYIEDVLKPYYVPFWRKMQRKYGTRDSPVYMQQDNHSVHKAKIVQKFLARMKVKLLPWPPSSPDLAPIENLWIQDKRVVSKRRHHIKTKEAMGNAIIESWWQIHPDRLETLARSLHTRMDLCIKAKGGPIKY
jgi:transposase